MIAPHLNTDVMNLFLRQQSQHVPEGEHRVMILDRAGYHRAKGLERSKAVTLLYLPPYSPELNPVEQLWHYLRDHYWSNRYFSDYEALEEAALGGWKKTCDIAEKVRSICAVSYI
jgi:transposase